MKKKHTQICSIATNTEVLYTKYIMSKQCHSLIQFLMAITSTSLKFYIANMPLIRNFLNIEIAVPLL